MLAPAPTEELRLRAEMIAIAAEFAPADGVHATAIEPLQLIRASAPAQPLPAVYEPGLVLVLQGRKQAHLGKEVLTYDPLHALVVSVTMLPSAQITEASREAPYLCVRLRADPRELASLVLDAGIAATPAVEPPTALQRGIQVARSSPGLLDALARLLRLLRAPADIPMLAPLAIREIFYRVLTGELGPRLRALAVSESHAQRIARAIELVKRRFDEPLRIEEVAAAAAMSPSTLHQHFKHVTSMSPLQYQKQLRLQEARRLLLGEVSDAASAGHRVGYESPSQFSREYARLFGVPPARDAVRMKQQAASFRPVV